ncbi:ATP/GTP-binding protein [Streptomyces sp. NPDC051453]|uniref:ATP/GTP-binding protein n=1 Tax=Streptomyces sp. NPDC051453 TaxID=3154941 RepID=UPI00344692FD
MLRRAAAAGILLSALSLPTASADDGGSGVGGPNCRAATQYVKVCARDRGRQPGTGGKARNASDAKSGKSSAPKCNYRKLDPQPPADNRAWGKHKPGEGKGAVYAYDCPGTMRVGVVWLPNVAAAPAIDPEVLAREAVDKMKLSGPSVASPRAAGKYTVGVPVWLWVNESPTTFGPNTATATAGGVTVTATAKVKQIVWRLGDGSTVTCAGPGTPYKAAYGMKDSPSCGHRYTKTSADAPGAKFRLTATSTWVVDWQVAGGGGETGQLTEIRQTQAQVAVGEVQVVG